MTGEAAYCVIARHTDHGGPPWDFQEDHSDVDPAEPHDQRNRGGDGVKIELLEHGALPLSLFFSLARTTRQFGNVLIEGLRGKFQALHGREIRENGVRQFFRRQPMLNGERSRLDTVGLLRSKPLIDFEPLSCRS